MALSKRKLRMLELTPLCILEERVARTLDPEKRKRWRNLRQFFKKYPIADGDTSHEILDRLARHAGAEARKRWRGEA